MVISNPAVSLALSVAIQSSMQKQTIQQLVSLSERPPQEKDLKEGLYCVCVQADRYFCNIL